MDLHLHLMLALRVLRLRAALARAEQSSAFSAEERTDLSRKWSQAEAEERIGRSQGLGQLPLDRISARLHLSSIDEWILLAACALELDPLFATTLSAIGGEEPRQGLTAKLLSQLFGLGADEGMALALGPRHPLLVSGLLEGPPSSAMVETLRPVRAASRTVAFLAGSDSLDALLAQAGEQVLALAPEQLEHLGETLPLVTRLVADEEPLLLVLEGAEGAGRRALAATAAHAVGRETLAVDGGRLSRDPQRFSAELRALRRECWLRGALPVIARIDQLAATSEGGAPRTAELVEALESPGAVAGVAVVTGPVGVELPSFRRRA